MLLAVTLLALAAGAQGVPPLPDLALDTFPPAAQAMIERAQLAAKRRSGDADAATALGRALQAWEQFESAHQAYARAAALAPRAFEPRYLDAVVLQRLARPGDAVTRLQEALAINPKYLPARVRLAEALLDSGDLAASAPLFEALLTEPAAEPAARVGLGRIAARQGRHEDAIRHYERAVELFPELGAAHYGLARAYRAVGRQEAAARALREHQRFGPRWPAIEDAVLASVRDLRKDPRAMLAKGVALAHAGEIEESISAHEAALESDPSLAQAHVNLLSLYGRAGNWQAAERHYKAALDAGAGGSALHYDYGVVLGRQGKWSEAEAAFRRAIEINPLEPNARNNLGQILERRGDLEGAAEQYRQAVEAQPSLRVARFNLARMLLVRKRLSEAITELEKLQTPRDAEAARYMFALSAARVMMGEVDEGRRLANEARELALEHGEHDLASAIARELEKLKQ